MKKITLFAFAIVALSMASCKKERVCECTNTTVNGTSTAETNTSKVTYTKISKGDAKIACQKQFQATTNTSSGTTTTKTQTWDCKLK